MSLNSPERPRWSYGWMTPIILDLYISGNVLVSDSGEHAAVAWVTGVAGLAAYSALSICHLNYDYEDAKYRGWLK